MTKNQEYALPVSYTHLDVYKRQALYRQGGKGAEEPGEGHADTDHRTPVDERGSESHDRPAT